jgi:hypothetical protein
MPFDFHAFVVCFPSTTLPWYSCYMHWSLPVRSVVTRLTTVVHFPACFVCTARDLGQLLYSYFTDGYTLHTCLDAPLLQKQFWRLAIQSCGRVDVHVLLTNPSNVSAITVVLTDMPFTEWLHCSITAALLFLPCIQLEYEISIALTLLVDKYIEQTIMANPFFLTDNQPHISVSVGTIAILYMH